jgi:hypothetical protein
MTQTLDVHGRISELDRSVPVSAPASTARATMDKSATFAITFGIAFAIVYTVFERLNWPFFTYHPAVGKVDFWMHAARSGEGPPMYWYGWLVLSGLVALVVAWAATLVPRERLQQATFFCCVLAALWPVVLALASLFTDGTTFNEQWVTWALWSGVPAFVGAAALTYFARPTWAERMWTSWLVIMPVGGLLVLGYSLKTYFLR